jgi:hypothetical protein
MHPSSVIWRRVRASVALRVAIGLGPLLLAAGCGAVGSLQEVDAAADGFHASLSSAGPPRRPSRGTQGGKLALVGYNINSRELLK